MNIEKPPSEEDKKDEIKDLKQENLTDEQKKKMQDEKDLAEGLELLRRVKESKGEKMPESLQKQQEELEQKNPNAEKSEDFKKTAISMELLKNLKNAKEGIDPKSLNLEGLSEEDRKYFEEAQEGLSKLAQLKREKVAKQEAVKKAEKEPVKCPKCGQENLGSSNFCGACGNQLREIPEADKPRIKEAWEKADKFEQTGKLEEKAGGMSVNEFLEISEKEAAMAKEKEAVLQAKETSEKVGEDKKETMEASIKDIQTRLDLLDFLDSVKGLQGTQNFFTSEQLKKIVTEVLDNKDEGQLNKVTRTAGLRDKVNEILIRERIEGMKKTG